MIKDTPTSKIRSMPMGLVEIHGKVSSTGDNWLIAPFSQEKCVYYRYVIEEYVSNKNSYEWREMEENEQRIPFYAIDDTGYVLVKPEDATFNVKVKNKFYQRNNGYWRVSNFRKMLYAYKNGGQAQKVDLKSLGLQKISDDASLGNVVRGDRRYFEYYVTGGDNLYVLGSATNEGGKVFIKKGQNEPTYIISDRNEKGLLKNMKKNIIIIFFVSVLFILISFIWTYFLTV